MKTVALSGTARRVGKTAVGAFLSRHLGTLAAVKVTPKHRAMLATTAAASASGSASSAESQRGRTVGALHMQAGDGVETIQPGPYQLIDQPKAVLAAGADTRDYWDSGAEPVFWLRAKDEGVLDGVRATRERLEAEAGQSDDEQSLPGAPTVLLVESDRYVEKQGPADAVLVVYPNGSDEFEENTFDIVARADALVVTKRRPGPISLPLLDHEDFPPEKLDLPAFAFNLDEDSIASDDRYELVEWLQQKLDQQPIQASDAACNL